MTIYEPWTLITDYLLTALAGGLAWRLRSRVAVDNSAARWWSRALALTAVSAFTGGTSHGFGPNWPAAVADTLWRATLLSLSLTAAAMALGLIHEFVPPGRRRPWLVLAGAKFGFFAALATLRPVFLVAIADYGLALLAWAAATLACRRAWRGWMLAAIGLSIIAAVVQQAKIGVSVHFNHNDLYHVIQAGALYLFYRSALRLGDRGGDPTGPAATGG